MDEAYFIGFYGQPARRLVGDLRREATLGDPIPEAQDASFGTLGGGCLYLVGETDQGMINVFRPEGGYAGNAIASVTSGGAAPCFVDVDERAEILAVANYKSGDLAVYRLDSQGSPSGEPAVEAHHGSGPDPERQEASHVHCVRFHQRWLYSVDLGADTVIARTYGAAPLELGAAFVAFAAPPGEGPRHLVFHPSAPTAYLLTELRSGLFVLDVGEDGSLTPRIRHTSLPAGFDGESLGGHLAINKAGDRLYASNRGHDSIAVFAVSDDGDLNTLQHVPTGGQSPRHFRLLQDRRLCVVAHEEGGGVTILPLDADGRLGDSLQTLPCEKAVFVGVY